MEQPQQKSIKRSFAITHEIVENSGFLGSNTSVTLICFLYHDDLSSKVNEMIITGLSIACKMSTRASCVCLCDPLPDETRITLIYYEMRSLIVCVCDPLPDETRITLIRDH